MERIVVPPVYLPRHYILEKSLHVLDQRILPLVQKHGRRGVERLQVDDPVANPALSDDFVNAVGNIDELRAVAGDPVEHTVEHRESPRIHHWGRAPGVIRSQLYFRDLGIRTDAHSLSLTYERFFLFNDLTIISAGLLVMRRDVAVDHADELGDNAIAAKCFYQFS